MSLYLVEHRHTPETCPTKDRDMMLMLGKHVMQDNADTFGIKIHADVVHPGEHRMMMVLEADTREPIDQFVQPFSMVGSVDVKEVTNCEEVVRTATC
jgi:hypothetical protein